MYSVFYIANPRKMNVETLKAELLRLPIEDRVQLLVAGLDSLSETLAAIEESWIEESIKRQREIESGTQSIRPLDEAMRDIFQ